MKTGVIVCVLLALGSGIYSRLNDADRVYRRGQQQYDDGDFAAALDSFAQARERAPLSNTAIHSSYYRAIILFQQERWQEAGEAFKELVGRFPEAQAAAEAMYHVGLCAEHEGRLDQAKEAFQETRLRFAGTMWATLAEQHFRNLSSASQVGDRP